MDQYVTLIENLEYDCFIKKKTPTENNSGNFNCCNKNINNNISNEMTKFSSFLDNQLKDIIEQQNALEKQYQNIQTSHNINNLNNLNNLINPKNTVSNFNQNNQSNIQENSNNNQGMNNNNYYIQENLDTNNFSLNISKSSNEINNECPNHHSHNNLHFSSSFTINNNNLNEKFTLGYNSINLNAKIKDANPVRETDKVVPNNQAGYTNNLNFNNINKSLNKINCICENKNCKNFIKSNVFCESDKITNFIDNQSQTLNTNNNFNNVNENDKFNDIDTLVAYINTNEESKTKKNKKKSQKKKNQQQKDLKVINKSGIYDEFVVENFRKNVYKDSCYAENIRKIKPIFSMDWLNKINNKVK